MLATWITEQPLVLLLFNTYDTGGFWLCLFYIGIISLTEPEIILIYIHMSQEGSKNHNHLSIDKKQQTEKLFLLDTNHLKEIKPNLFTYTYNYEQMQWENINSQQCYKTFF